jgi:hypothetical protein
MQIAKCKSQNAKSEKSGILTFTIFIFHFSFCNALEANG